MGLFKIWVRAAMFMSAVLSLCGTLSVAAAPPLAVYGKLPAFERAALSPSGDRLALIGVVGDARTVIVLDQNQKPFLSFPVGDAKIRSLSWGGEEFVLLRVGETVALDSTAFSASKTELTGMLVVPLKGGKPWWVFSNMETITGGVRGYYGAVQREGRWFGYFGGITMERSYVSGNLYLKTTSPALYEVDLGSRATRRVAPGGESINRSWIVDGQGKVAATFDFVSENGEWRLRNGESRMLASGKAPTGGTGLVGLGRSPGSIVYQIEDEAGREHWFEVAGGKSEAIAPDKLVLGSYTDPRSYTLIGYLEDADVPQAHFYSPRHQKVWNGTKRAFPNMNVSLVDWNATFDRLIVTTDGPGDPGTWWLVDVRTGRADTLGTSYPMKSADVAPVRMVPYKAADGLAMAGVLTLPPGRPAKNLPVIVLPHGGPSARDYPTFDWWPQALASRGYAVFQPNFRGSTGLGAQFQKAGNGEWGRKMQTDMSDGLAELARQGIVDPKRACIMGGSYGGYAALVGVTLQQGIYRCAVSVAGVGDVYALSRTQITRSGGNRTMIRVLEQERGSGRDLKLVSPINFAERANAPIMLIHGKDDVVVLYQQSVDMAAALRRAGKPVEFVTLAGEDHWLSKGETRLAMLQAAVAFVEKHNPPDPK